jgi:hypothetical protein
MLQNTDLVGEEDREGLDRSIAPSLLNGGIKCQTLCRRKKGGAVVMERDAFGL